VVSFERGAPLAMSAPPEFSVMRYLVRVLLWGIALGFVLFLVHLATALIH
jgi:hypothetical protein